MAAVPVTRTFVAGEVVLASYFNTNIRDVLNFLVATPIFRATQTVVQSIANGSNVPITFSTEIVDSAGGHSTSSNTSRYTAVYPGYYGFSGGISYSSDATGIRVTDWGKNGTILDGSRDIRPAISGFSHSMGARAEKAFLAVGDYMEIWALQNRGSALNSSVTTSEQSSFNLRWESN